MTRSITKLFTILLFLYSCLFTFALVFGALSRGLNLGNLITTTLFLPVVYYFVRELNWQAESVTGGFSLLPFLVQRNVTFIITLVLFAAAILITFLKVRGILI